MRPFASVVFAVMGLAISGALRAEKPAATQPATTQSATSQSSPPFQITCRKTEDAVTVSTDGGKAILSITSPSGIGKATIDRTDERWPKEVVLRVRLRGLESLTISSGNVKLAASVLSHSGNTRLLHLRTDGKEGPQLTKDSPYWMDIHVLDARGKPAAGLPEKDGCFEMTIPKALLDEKAKTVTIEWIDFYRG
jgi:hypothetical protein